MNVKEISKDTSGTLPHYFATAAPLTMVTIWVIMAFRASLQFKSPSTSVSLSRRKQVPVRRQNNFLDAARMALAAAQTNAREE